MTSARSEKGERMPRYIDAEKLRYVMERYDDYAVDIVDDAPTVDAVEVVRCRDCNKRNGDYCHRYHDGYSAFIHQDDFCSYGERREDG